MGNLRVVVHEGQFWLAVTINGKTYLVQRKAEVGEHFRP